jgi:N-acetylmuramoyl-L-alanine amidase
MLASDIPTHEQDFAVNKTDTNGTVYSLAPSKLGSVPIVELVPTGVSDYYYSEETAKDLIVLHFTAGYLKGDLAALCKNDNHVSVSYVIARNGTIYKLFDPKHWSYHLGPGSVGGNENGSKRSIGIEISNIGPLTKSGNNLISTYNTNYCSANETQYFQSVSAPYRDYSYFATFTSEQYQALAPLLHELSNQFSIPFSFIDVSKRYNVFASNADAQTFKGIASHVNFMSAGKWDIGPAFDWDALTRTQFSLPLDITTLETKLSPTAEAFAKYYTHTEQEFTGGYFPVGANTSWHGGLHLKGTETMPVHAIAPGTVVCARMPVQDPKEDQLAYGSRNFVLIRHDDNAKPWYSLYYHLKSIAMDSEEAQKISWLGASFLKFKKNRNFREEPNEKSTIIKTFQANTDEAEIIDKSQSPWYEVVDPATGTSGFVNFAADVADEVAKPSADLSDKFSQGDAVYQIGKTVNAGDIRYVGKGIHFENGAKAAADIIHWEIFSSELIGQGWEKVEDADDNYTCNSETLIKLVDKDRDNELEPDEIIDFFADEQKAATMRGYACKFKSDWSIDWKNFSEQLKKQNILAYPDKLSLYNFWPDACKCDTRLQTEGKVWHYNPIAFLKKQTIAVARAAFGADCFEPDCCLPLPMAILPMLQSMAGYCKGNFVKQVVALAHTGAMNDTIDATELSNRRSQAIKTILMLDKDGFGTIITNSWWGNRERKIMLSYLQDTNGAAYYRGVIDDLADVNLKNAVERFQGENKLKVDGDAGKSSFTKMFELLLTKAGLQKFTSVANIGCGSAHPPLKDAPARTLELFVWGCDPDPTTDAYTADPQKTYTAWTGSISTELSTGGASAAADADIFDKDLFLYSPADETFIRIPHDEVESMYDAVDECCDHLDKIEEARKEKDLAKQAEKLGRVKDDFIAYMKKSAKATAARQSGEGSDAMAESESGIDRDMKEFVSLNIIGTKIKKNQNKPRYSGFVYVRSDKIKSHWRCSQDRTLERLFGPEEKEPSGGLKKELAEKFKEKIAEPLKVKNVLWEVTDHDLLKPQFRFSTKPDIGGDKWDFSAGAQFFRFTAGMAAKSEIDLKTMNVNVELAGQATFALAEAKVSGTWYIPDKKGVDIVRLLKVAETKLVALTDGSGRVPARTTLTPAQRTIFLRVKVGSEAKGFVGASASFSFPRLEIKPGTKTKDKGSLPGATKPEMPDIPTKGKKAVPERAEQMALVTLEGKAFAGAQAEGKLTSAAEWSDKAEAKEWKNLLSGEAGLAGTLGAAIEGKLYFGYMDGRIRFCCSVQAAFIVGGKTFWDFELGLKEGLDFIAQLARCVDYHYIADIGDDLWEAMGAYKYAMLVNPVTSTALLGLYEMKNLDTQVDVARNFVRDSRKMYQQVSNFVDKTVQDKVFNVEKNKMTIINAQVERLKTSPPEAVARYLLVLMKTPEESDYIYITKALDVVESDHEFRWVVRYLGLLVTLSNLQNATPAAPVITFKGKNFKAHDGVVFATNAQLHEVMDMPAEGRKEKDVMLEVGVLKLLAFGRFRQDNENRKYTTALKTVFVKNGVKYA